MARAREILGVQQRWLGFVDSGFPEGDPLPPLPDGCFALEPLETATEPLVRAVREFRPHVMLTYDEKGGYPHPDHVKCHEVSVEAFEAAGDPERYPGAGEPWQPLKLYYHLTFNKERILALHAAMEQAYSSRPTTTGSSASTRRREARQVGRDDPRPVRRPLRDQGPRPPRPRHPDRPQRVLVRRPDGRPARAWPTEDYHLARSLVDTEVPEDDLFR